MLHILGIIAITFLIALLIGASLILGLLRHLFGMGRKRRSNTRTENGGRHNPSDTGGKHTYRYHDGQWVKQHSTAHTDDDAVTPEEGELHINPKKVFGKDEGEYVDFEEVKS